MDPLYLKSLLIVFIVHLAVFGRIALKTRRGYHLLFVLTFISLIAMTALRIWAPNTRLGEIPIWSLFRWSAWAFTVLGAVLWLRFRRFKKA